jgi:restriction system protein
VRTGRGVFALNDGKQKPYTGKLAKKKSRARGREPLSFTDAAEHVLKLHGDRKPMHYRDVTAKALKLGLVETKGRTPHATLYAQVLSEIKRRERRGEQARFMKLGKGYIALSEWRGRGLAFQIEQQNRDVRKRLLKRVKTMDPAEFEELVARLLAALGFESVEVTCRSGDGGIDVRGTLAVGEVIRTRLAVQVKRWKQNVRAPVIQQVRGSLGAHEQGLIITTSDFSRGARDEAERLDATPVGLMNGEQLVNLLVENDIGVRRSAHDLLELGEEEGE